ncbi:MAG: dioxygenase [Desulfobulbaceae bacterium]|nr:dioxygenase [Desulfobulbaceae bacterium]
MGNPAASQPARVLYLPHGGGPLPLLGDPGHARMRRFLRELPPTLGAPEAILLISAHWQETQPTVTAAPQPSLIYDYYAFPPAAYTISYPAVGAPELAGKVQRLLTLAGIASGHDHHRGFDHGLYVPLKLMYPEAQIPCVQLSLQAGLDPAVHLQIGRALAGLKAENLLIIGSGFSFHNLNAFIFAGPTVSDPRNEAFQAWLIETCTTSALTEQARTARLIAWRAAPSASYAHPYEDHLLPLHVCYGLAGNAARLVFADEIMGKKSCALLW